MRGGAHHRAPRRRAGARDRIGEPLRPGARTPEPERQKSRRAPGVGGDAQPTTAATSSSLRASPPPFDPIAQAPVPQQRGGDGLVRLAGRTTVARSSFGAACVGFFAPNRPRTHRCSASPAEDGGLGSGEDAGPHACPAKTPGTGRRRRRPGTSEIGQVHGQLALRPSPAHLSCSGYLYEVGKGRRGRVSKGGAEEFLR